MVCDSRPGSKTARAGSHVAPPSVVRAKVRRPAAVACQPVPRHVHAARVERVRRDRLLVVEELRAVDDQRVRVAPGAPAVGRAADGDGVHRPRRERAAAGRERRLPRGAVGADGHPRVGRALVVAAVARVPARAARERHDLALPRAPAVEGHAGHQPAGAAVGPAVLLPHADQVIRIARIHGHLRLDLRIDIHRSNRRRAAGRVGRRAGDDHARRGARKRRRAHRHRVGSVPLRDPAALQHRIAHRAIRRVAVIRIRAPVPHAVDGHGARGTGTGAGIGQRDEERASRLVDVALVVGIGDDLAQHVRALVGRGGEEVRVALRGRDVEAAHRQRARAARIALARPRAEREARARPSAHRAAVEGVDLVRERGDEVVVEAGVVVLDHRRRRALRVRVRAAEHADRQRGARDRSAAPHDAKFSDTRRIHPREPTCAPSSRQSAWANRPRRKRCCVFRTRLHARGREALARIAIASLPFVPRSLRSLRPFVP